MPYAVCKLNVGIDACRIDLFFETCEGMVSLNNESRAENAGSNICRDPWWEALGCE